MVDVIILLMFVAPILFVLLLILACWALIRLAGWVGGSKAVAVAGLLLVGLSSYFWVDLFWDCSGSHNGSGIFSACGGPGGIIGAVMMLIGYPALILGTCIVTIYHYRFRRKGEIAQREPQ